MEQQIKIQFGNLKPEIKSDFYLGGNERFCEGKILDAIVNMIVTSDGIKLDNYIKVPTKAPNISRLININYFESIEIINEKQK